MKTLTNHSLLKAKRQLVEPCKAGVHLFQLGKSFEDPCFVRFYGAMPSLLPIINSLPRMHRQFTATNSRTSYSHHHR